MRVQIGPLKMILKSPAHHRAPRFHERNNPFFWDLRFNFCCAAVLRSAINACREQGWFIFLNCSPFLLKNYLNLNKILELSEGKSSPCKQGLLRVLWQFVQVLYNLDCILWCMNRWMALLIVKPTDSKLCWRHSFRKKNLCNKFPLYDHTLISVLGQNSFWLLQVEQGWNNISWNNFVFGFNDCSFPKQKRVKSCRLKSFEAATSNLLLRSVT